MRRRRLTLFTLLVAASDGKYVVADGPGGASLVFLTSQGKPARSIAVECSAGPQNWQSLGS